MSLVLMFPEDIGPTVFLVLRRCGRHVMSDFLKAFLKAGEVPVYCAA